MLSGMTATIDNVVFACPGNTEESYQRHGRELATFYAELLGMRITREDWFVVANPDDDDAVRLAFGDGPIDYQPPRWPDPEHPQQLHVDIPVTDLAEAESRALALGASLLQDRGDYRSYADPVGHPFCFYLADQPQPGPIGRVVVDCFSPRALAGFYAELLDMPRWELDTPERVVIARADGRLPALAFQHAQFPAPRWPDPAYPQQVHLDIWMKGDDPEPVRELALRLGAIRLPALGGSQPVFADPAGHPFCL
jgi:hypothetical protein